MEFSILYRGRFWLLLLVFIHSASSLRCRQCASDATARNLDPSTRGAPICGGSESYCEGNSCNFYSKDTNQQSGYIMTCSIESEVSNKCNANSNSNNGNYVNTKSCFCNDDEYCTDKENPDSGSLPSLPRTPPPPSREEGGRSGRRRGDSEGGEYDYDNSSSDVVYTTFCTSILVVFLTF